MKKINFENMTKDEALKYCWEYEEEFIKDSGTNGREEFDSMVSLLEDGYIKPVDLPDYGMDY